MLVGDMLAASAARWPRSTAVIEQERRISYRDLDRLSNKIANAICGAGWGKSRIGVLSTNRIEYSAIFFGVARSGALQVHFSYRTTEPELASILARTGIEVLFAHVETLPLARRARLDLKGLRAIVVFGAGTDWVLEPGEIAWHRWLAAADEEPAQVELDDADDFCVTFTGGTSGQPKGVVVSHRARTMVSEAAKEPFELGPKVVACLTTPLFHVAGLFAWHLIAIAAGSTLIFVPKWDVEDYMAVARREKVRHTLAVPTQVNAIVSHRDFGPDALPNLRLFNYAGAPTPPSVVERALQRFPGLSMLEHYGQSETGAVAWRPPRDATSRARSVGIPLPGIELIARSLDGRELQRGETGEILVRGPNLFSKYWQDPEETARAFTKDGWLKTGDVGYLGGDNYIFLVDRAKDIIISGGENIYSAEIENVLDGHPAVWECAVVGIPDERWGEVPVAHIVLAEGARVSADEIIRYVGERIARHKRPRFVTFVPSLPKSVTGKIQKLAIREPYWKAKSRR